MKPFGLFCSRGVFTGFRCSNGYWCSRAWWDFCFTLRLNKSKDKLGHRYRSIICGVRARKAEEGSVSRFLSCQLANGTRIPLLASGFGLCWVQRLSLPVWTKHSVAGSGWRLLPVGLDMTSLQPQHLRTFNTQHLAQFLTARALRHHQLLLIIIILIVIIIITLEELAAPRPAHVPDDVTHFNEFRGLIHVGATGPWTATFCLWFLVFGIQDCGS